MWGPELSDQLAWGLCRMHQKQFLETKQNELERNRLESGVKYMLEETHPGPQQMIFPPRKSLYKNKFSKHIFI